MWPHWPQLLWCQVWPVGIFLSRPYFVFTVIQGSGTLCTIHSPLASSSSTCSRSSSPWTIAGSRSNLRDDLVTTLTSIGMASILSVRMEIEAGFLELHLHHVHEDHVEALVDLLDHVHHSGHVPDEVELAERLLGDLPARLGRVQRLGRERASPPLE